MKIILQFILKIISKIILWRYNPVIIGITGSVGKTSVKEAALAILRRRFNVRGSVKNYNNEIGVPLSIIGSESGGKSFWRWLKIITRGLYIGLVGSGGFPRILVLEMGADKPGDIGYITKFVKPRIGVVTAIGEMPAHIEFFPERDALIREKFELVRSLSADGTAILNYDDLSVRDMRNNLPDRAVIITYGFGEGSMVKGSDYKISGMENRGTLLDMLCMSFKMEFQGSLVPMKIPGLLGRAQVYAVLAASAAALSLGMNLVEISEGISGYRSPAGRMKLLGGIKNSWIIDDSYNSSPLAAVSALETLEKFEGYRKIAVLGDMLELGGYTERAHTELGGQAAAICDLIFAVGPRANFIYQGALSFGFDRSNIFFFDQHQVGEAGKLLQDKIRDGDVILIKGSQSMRMEKIVKEIMAEPERAQDLLVRQEWPDA